MNEAQQHAKQPATMFAGTYGHPIHPILVTIPIGCWVASIVFDIASFGTRDPAMFAQGSMWLIGLGVVAALVAALFGLIDFIRIEPGTRAFLVGLTHLLLNVTVVGLYILSWAIRFVHAPMARVPAGLFVLNLVAFAILLVSGVLGGTLAYRYGVRVASEATQTSGFEKIEGGRATPWRAPREA